MHFQRIAETFQQFAEKLKNWFLCCETHCFVDAAGAMEPVHVGTGPMADVQHCHLEIACLSDKTKTLVAGHGLHRMVDSVKLLLKKVDAVAALTLVSNGALSSGWNCKESIDKLIDKLLDLKATGQFLE